MNHEQAITRASKILVQNNVPLEPVAVLELARMLREEPSAEPVEAFDHEAWVASLKPGVQLLQKSRGSWRTATVIPNPDWDKGNDEHVWTHAEGEADGYWQRDNTDDEEIRPLPTPSEADALRAELAEAKRLRDEALRSFRAREDAIEKAEKRAGTTEMERDALRAKLAEVERECTDARATLSHVNKALGYPVDVNKWDDVEAAGLMLVDAIRKSRERHDSAIEELRRVTLDRDAKKERADKADQARDAANAVNADMGSQMCRIRAALDSKPGTWRQMADSMLDVIDSLKAERDAAVRRAELLATFIGSRNAIAKICGALGLASADTYEEDADAIIAAIDRLRDEAKAARKACPVDVSTLRLLRASGLFGNEINTLAGWALEEEARR